MNQDVQEMQPQKTWFFTDSTDRVFSVNEKEAFSLLTENSRWRRQDIRMLGCSDGTTYFKTLQESAKDVDELVDKVKKKKDNLNRLIQGCDRLIFEQFKDEDDEIVVRARKKIEEAEKELAPLEDELNNIRTSRVQKAFDAELEVARGNMENPQDFSVVTKSSGDARNADDFMKSFKNARRVI